MDRKVWRKVWRTLFRNNTKVKGIRYYCHSEKKHGVHPDRFFQIRFQSNGRRIEESIGWESEKSKPRNGIEAQALRRLEELKAAARVAEQMGAPWTPETNKQRKAKQKKIDRRENATIASAFAGHRDLASKRLESKKRKSKTADDELSAYENWIEPELHSKRLKVELERLKEPISNLAQTLKVGRKKMEKRRKQQIARIEDQIRETNHRPSIGKKSLGEVTHVELDGILGYMVRQGKSERTMTAAMATISAAYKYAARDGLFDGVPPTDLIERPGGSSKRRRHLTPEEANTLVSTLHEKSPLVAGMVVISLLTGMRRSELLRLRWEDIDLDERILKILHTKNGIPRGLMMDRRVVKVFHNRRDLDQPKDKSELVFPGKAGKARAKIPAIYFKTVQRLFNETVTDPLDRVVWHTLRHSFCTWLAERGAPDTLARKATGHLTAAAHDGYLHISAKATKGVIDLLTDLPIAQTLHAVNDE